MEWWPVILISGIVLVAVFLAIMGAFVWSVPAQTSTPMPPSTIHPTQRPIAPSGQAPVSARPAPDSQPVAAPPKPVDFALIPGQQTNCGTTCRETVATLRNTGDQTAHNVCVTLTAHNSDEKLIPLNGGDSVKVCIGDLTGGQSKSQNIRIEADCGFLFSDCIGKKLTLNTVATSTEKTVTFPAQTISG